MLTSLEFPIPVPHSGSGVGADRKELPLIHMVRPSASVYLSVRSFTQGSCIMQVHA